MCIVTFSRVSEYSALEKWRKFDGKPKWAVVRIVDACSHRCAWCYDSFWDKHVIMPLDQLNIVLTKLKAMGVHQVTLSGGEPTEHPQFREAVALSVSFGFLLHLSSHGEHIDADLARWMGDHNVRQVQLNYQGRRRHDHVHGVAGSHERQRAAIGHLQAVGIEVATTTTVAAYNVDEIGEVFDEAAGLGVTRLRVFESTGRGNPWRKGLEARSIFAAAEAVARARGYDHTVSYDPEWQSAVSSPRVKLANMHIDITGAAKLRFCGAVQGGDEPIIGDMLTQDPDDLLAAYTANNRRARGGHAPFCAARSGFPAGTIEPARQPAA